MTSNQFYGLCILIMLLVVIAAIGGMLYWWNRWYDAHELLIMEQEDGDELRSSIKRLGRELDASRNTIQRLRGRH
jgi:uncharacterized protein YxeA